MGGNGGMGVLGMLVASVVTAVQPGAGDSPSSQAPPVNANDGSEQGAPPTTEPEAGSGDGASVDGSTATHPQDDELSGEPPTAEPSIGETRARLETAVSTLGDLHDRSLAVPEGGGAWGTCVRDKHERARRILEVATDDLLLAQSVTATEDQRALAAGKLNAAAAQLEGLVKQAGGCDGDAPEPAAETENEVDPSHFIPVVDPTHSGAQSPVPPAVDAQKPPTVSSPVL